MKIRSLKIIILLAFFQVGCATYEKSSSIPSVDEGFSFEVLDKDVSSWSGDVIVGAYSIPESQVVISGHQKGGGGGGFLFGFLGVLIEHSLEQSSGKKTIASVSDQLGFYLNEQIEAELDVSLQKKDLAGIYKINDDSKNHVLSIKPMLVLTYTWDENKVRPFTILNVSLHEKGREEKLWSSRYISSIGKARVLFGEGSWLENDKSALNGFISENLKLSIDFMLEDFLSPYDRKTKDSIVVEGNVPFLKSVYRLLGQRLLENDKFVAYVPVSNDASVISGVLIADKKYVATRVATPKDKPYKKIFSEEEKKENEKSLDRRF
jgi:hypothetical protein